MSGPALKQWDSHSSIHEAALGEAGELTELMRQCVHRRDKTKALQVAYIAVEHWESRTLCHAESEEEGLYAEFVADEPELRERVISLTRDHTLMRRLVAEIKQILLRQGSLSEIVKRLDALILIDQLHNEDEGKLVSERGKARGTVT